MGYDVGDAIVATYEVRDEDGVLVNPTTIVLTITKPDLTDSTPSVANPPAETGLFEATAFLFSQPGRHRFRWVTTVPNTGETFTVDVKGVGTGLPTLQQVKDYLDTAQTGVAATYTDAVLNDALAAETAAQARRCRIPANYPDDLANALKRRVQRNLAMRNLPLAILQGDADVGSSTLLPGDDPEVRRFERPYRRMVVG